MEQKVSQISLDKLKENNQNDIKNIYNNIESLLLEPKVIEYLKNCKLLEEKQSFDSFLNGLELGEDGTLFNKYDDNKQKGLSSTHYGLSIILRNAFRILLDNDIKSVARHEIYINLDDIFKVARKILKNNGTIAIVHRTDRLIDIIDCMKKNNIEPKRLQLVYPKFNKESNIVLIEGAKNGKSSLKVLPPIYVHDEDGNYLEEIKKMFEEE